MTKRIFTMLAVIGMAAFGFTTVANAYDGFGQDGGSGRAVSYINRDTGAATENADVATNSSCRTPDQYDRQAFTKNVHNDACFLDDAGNKLDGPASFQSIGVGAITACPDPDNAGPKIAVLSDTNGDGRKDLCFQTGYQQKLVAGDLEFHARVNNTGTPGTQYVVWCSDRDQDGCSDEYNKSTIRIDWSADGVGRVSTPTGGRTASYINTDFGAASANPDVASYSSCFAEDSRDQQKFSDAGTTNRNVHNDACFLGSNGEKYNGPASFDSSGVGYISACPDPDGAGPEFSILSDRDGDGRKDLCFQSSFQQKEVGATGVLGELEFHARLNNNTAQTGTQTVVWCADADRDGCSDEYRRSSVSIEWSATGMSSGNSWSW